MSCKTPDEKDLIKIRRRPEHWKSLDDVGRSGTEFPGGLPAPGAPAGADATRRDFLTLMGFSLGAASLAACRAPTQHAVPLPVASDQMVAGVSNYYATTCGGCASSCGMVVKQRDGRPIKADGNEESPLFGGGSCAAGQATVLSLYDDERLKGPSLGGKEATWAEIDHKVLAALAESKASGKKIVLLSGTITSPSTRQIIAEWSKRFPSFRHVVYDGVSMSAMRAANEQSFGEEVVPHYAFDKARVIVAIEADFLGTWLSPVEFARQYARTRKPSASPSFHVQIESGMSITGTNADLRLAVAPSEIGAVVAGLLGRIAKKAHAAGVRDVPTAADARKLDQIAEELWKHRGASLVVCGSQDVNVQIAVNALNSFLGNIGQTIDVALPSLQRQGDDAAVADLLDEMAAGHVGTLILHGVNPLYDHPEAARFHEALAKVGFVVSLSGRRDETAAEAAAIAPEHHFLESWGDAEPVASYFSLLQPLIAPLFDTRAAPESLLRWIGVDTDHRTYVRNFWHTAIFPQVQEPDGLEFEAFWDRSLQRGFVMAPPAEAPPQPPFDGDYKRAVEAIAEERRDAEKGRGPDHYELHFYESVAVRDGHDANNPWLQELPDPVSKVAWGNYAAVAPSLARKLGVENGDVIAIRAGAAGVAVPVLVQPGQHPGTLSIAVGYGRKLAGKVGNGLGVNVFPLLATRQRARTLTAPAVMIAKTGRSAPLANTQSHFSMEGRPIVREISREELAHEERREREGKGEEKEELPNLWAERLQGEHWWGMSIDLNACTGCSACVVSCVAENNIAVVGADQVRRTRIMHWLRLDHYYSGSEDDPSSVHQPMMCQHCAHAPCETVCPVLATTTSSEGINQQVYNRCIGTRYCLNNCPYKVRRFNWYNYTESDDFDFHMRSPLGRMVLNPDVTVRTRGVMEKCSLCVQRIQLAKNTALKEKRDMADGDVQTACQQACPTQAIVFGDLKDPNSRLSKLTRGPRSYQVLEDLGTRPNVSYLKKVRNGQET